jgi:hypothetical protein
MEPSTAISLPTKETSGGSWGASIPTPPTTTSARGPADRLAGVLGARVDGGVRARRRGPPQRALARVDGDDGLGAQEPGQEDRVDADAAAADQDGAVLEGNGFRERQDTRGRDNDPLGEGAVAGHAEDPRLGAQAEMTAPTGVAAAAGLAREQQHPVADLDAGDALPHRIHDAGALVAHDHRKRGQGELAVGGVEVGTAEACGPNRDAYLAGPRDGIRNLLHPDLRSFVQSNGLHGAPSLGAVDLAPSRDPTGEGLAHQ